MSGVQPTTGLPPATSGGSGGQQQSAAQTHDDAQKQNQPPQAQLRPAVSLSASLAPLAEGLRFDAVLAGQDGDGLPLIRSANGSFVIVGDAEDLPPNARLVLQVLTLGTTVRAAVLSANGQALHPPLQISLELTRAAPAPATPADMAAGRPPALSTPAAPAAAIPVAADAAPAALGPATPRLAVGAPLVARLVAGATGGALGAGYAATHGAAAAHSGVTYLLRVLSVGNPAPQAKPAAPAPATGHGATTAAADKAAGAGIPAPAAAAVANRAAAIPGYGPAAAAQAPTNQLHGMIVGRDAAGQMLFRSPAGLLALQSAADLPAGTSLSVEVISKTTPADRPLLSPRPAAVPFEPLSELLSHGRDWPDLKEALEILRALEPTLAAQLMAKVMPMPNKRLASTLLFFFAALKAGNLSQWLGTNVREALERAGRRDLMRRLDDDFTQVRRLAGETGGGDWRTLLLPLYDGHDLHQLMLFYRHHGRHGDDHGDNEESTRFVLNLVLSTLGPMQLDGLVQNRRFNLFVRSKQPLDSAVQRDLSQIFSEGLDATGWQGTLAFQVGGRFPVSPLEDVAREIHGDGLVV